MKGGWTTKDKQDGHRPCHAESYRPVVYRVSMPLHVQRNQRILELPTGNTSDGFRGMVEGGTMAACRAPRWADSIQRWDGKPAAIIATGSEYGNP